MIKNLLWNIDDFVNDDSIKSTIVYFLSSVNPTLKKSRRLCYVGGTPFATLPPFRNTFSTNENFASGPLSATLPKNYDLLNLKYRIWKYRGMPNMIAQNRSNRVRYEWDAWTTVWTDMTETRSSPLTLRNHWDTLARPCIDMTKASNLPWVHLWLRRSQLCYIR